MVSSAVVGAAPSAWLAGALTCIGEDFHQIERLLTSLLGSWVQFRQNLSVMNSYIILTFVTRMALMPTLIQARCSAVFFSIHFTLINCIPVSFHCHKFKQTTQ